MRNNPLKYFLIEFGSLVDFLYIKKKKYKHMINLITNKDVNFKHQIENLIGKEVSLTTEEITSLAHLTTGNLWIIKVLEKLNLSIDDIIHEGDREILRQEIEKNNIT
jgi:hypothetical protein